MIPTAVRLPNNATKIQSSIISAHRHAGVGAGVVVLLLPDGVIRAQTDPVGDRPVLLHLLAQGHLGAEGLVGRLP